MADPTRRPCADLYRWGGQLLKEGEDGRLEDIRPEELSCSEAAGCLREIRRWKLEARGAPQILAMFRDGSISPLGAISSWGKWRDSRDSS